MTDTTPLPPDGPGIWADRFDDLWLVDETLDARRIRRDGRWEASSFTCRNHAGMTGYAPFTRIM